MAMRSWKAIDTYEASNLRPTVMHFSAHGNVIVTADVTTTMFFEILNDNITPQGFVVEQNNISDERVWNVAVSQDGTSTAKTLENRVLTYKNSGFNTWASTLVYHAPHNDFYGAGIAYNTVSGNNWLAIGAPNGFLDSNDEEPKGYVNVFDYTLPSGSPSIGSDIIGENFNDMIGYVVYFQNNRLALMAATGLLYLYEYNGSNWNKINSTDIGIGVPDNTIFDPNQDAAQRVYQYTADALFNTFGYIFGFATPSGTALFIYNVTTDSQVRVDANSPQKLACIHLNAAGDNLLVSYVNSNLFRVYQLINSTWTLTNTVTTPRIINVSRFDNTGTKVMVSGTDTVTGKDYLTYYQYTLDSPPSPPVTPPVVPAPTGSTPTPAVPTPAVPTQPVSGTPTSKSATAKSTSLPLVIGIGSIIAVLVIIAVVIILIHSVKK